MKTLQIAFALLVAVATLNFAAVRFDAPPAVAQASAQAQPAASCSAPATLTSADATKADLSSAQYDRDFPPVNYSGLAQTNAVARLQERLNSGEVKLTYVPGRGYLDSVLAALKIDPSSQTLVFSRSSLQVGRITSRTPRAIYFNDDAYVAWVPGTDFLEVAAVDCQRGPVFYTFANHQTDGHRFARENGRCLTCHDTYGNSGGGTPGLATASIPVDRDGRAFPETFPTVVTDRTPVNKRWAGWYVTGNAGRQAHLGNILTDRYNDFSKADPDKSGDVETVASLFDVHPYLSQTSDIVALMVMEHQTDIQSQITEANFKSRSVLVKDLGDDGLDTAWADLPAATQTRLKRPLDALVDKMLLTGAAKLDDKIASGSGYDQWFQRQGVRDPAGRSLRDLDLKTRLFRYPLSYLIYSEAFDGMPRSAKDYVYTRIGAVLTGANQDAKYQALSADDRKAILEILTATKPDFARALG